MLKHAALAASLTFAQAAGAQTERPLTASDIVISTPDNTQANAEAQRRYGFNNYAVVCPVFGSKLLIQLGTNNGAADPATRYGESEVLGLFSALAGEAFVKTPINSLFNLGTIGPGGAVRPANTLKDYGVLKETQNRSETERVGMSATDRADWQPLLRHALDFCTRDKPVPQ